MVREDERKFDRFTYHTYSIYHHHRSLHIFLYDYSHLPLPTKTQKIPLFIHIRFLITEYQTQNPSYNSDIFPPWSDIPELDLRLWKIACTRPARLSRLCIRNRAVMNDSILVNGVKGNKMVGAREKLGGGVYSGLGRME